MSLLDYYKLIAQECAGMVVSDDGSIDSSVDGVLAPVLVNKKKLIMPTREFLSRPDWDQFTAFHPMSEKTSMGESEVLRTIRMYMYTTLNQDGSMILEAAIKLAASPALHKKLPAKVKRLLAIVPEADDRSVKDMGKILDRLGSHNRAKLISIFLKRKGKLDGKEYSRVCSVDFPILTDANDDTREILGVQVRVKDYEPFKALIRWVYGVEKGYSRGTNTAIAPYLTVLLQSWFAIATHINEIVELLSPHLPELKVLGYDVSWSDFLDEFPKYQLEIPALEGNTGVVDEEVAAQSGVAPQTTTTQQRSLASKMITEAPQQPAAVPLQHPTQPMQQMPGTPVPQVTAAPGGTISWDDIRPKAAPQQQYGGWGQPPVQQVGGRMSGPNIGLQQPQQAGGGWFGEPGGGVQSSGWGNTSQPNAWGF